MIIKVIIDGEVYFSDEFESDRHVYVNQFIETLRNDLVSWKMDLDNGDILVLGTEAVQRAQFIFAEN